MAPDLYGYASASSNAACEPMTSYGISERELAERRKEVYPSLNETVYLDHAASTPAPAMAMQAFAQDCAQNLYANPHSRSPASVATRLKVEAMRERVLAEVFGLSTADQRLPWELIWTSGATAALKLVADAFPWRAGSSHYTYLKQSHTSLVGVRGAASSHGARIQVIDGLPTCSDFRGTTEDDSSLFGYSAQSNATGQRIGLSLTRRMKQARPGLRVLVDAASYLSTSALELGEVPEDEAPDFVVCSFYKLYGWPTGLGCLLVKKEAGRSLRKEGYFGGGTVDYLGLDEPFVHRPRAEGSLHARFEDGTLPYLDIIALQHAMDCHLALYRSFSAVSSHVAQISTYARYKMASLHHFNGRPVVKLHHDFAEAPPEHGPIIGFSLLTWDGQWVGHVQLEQLATINGFQIRTGTLCNSGAIATATGLTDEDLRFEYDRGRICSDDQEFGGIHPDQQKALGIARVSFGASSTMADAQAWLDFLQRFYVVSSPPDARRTSTSTAVKRATLTRVTIYPIKSCSGHSIEPILEWQVTPSGLLYDREWVLVSTATGKHLSQKRYPKMARIQPIIDLYRREMRVGAPGKTGITIPLDAPTESNGSADAYVCNDRVQVGASYSAKIDRWFSDFLGVRCSLRRIPSRTSRHAHFGSGDATKIPIPISLSNESPFLLISSASNRRVNDWIDDAHDPVESACFRANFEIDSGLFQDPLEPFAEDGSDLVSIGDSLTFQKLANCRRCLMVCVNPYTAEVTNQPFSALAKHRRSTKGRIEFGIHMMLRSDLAPNDDEKMFVQVGDLVTFTTT